MLGDEFITLPAYLIADEEPAKQPILAKALKSRGGFAGYLREVFQSMSPLPANFSQQDLCSISGFRTLD